MQPLLDFVYAHVEKQREHVATRLGVVWVPARDVGCLVVGVFRVRLGSFGESGYALRDIK